MPGPRLSYHAADGKKNRIPELWTFQDPYDKSDTVEEMERQSLQRIRAHPGEALWQDRVFMYGDTFLHQKMRYGRSKSAFSVAWLREYVKDCPPGALELRDRYGCTPLHLAARSGRVDYLAALLDGDPSSSTLINNDGETALHLALKIPSRALGAVKCLVERCPEILNVTDAHGQTPAGFVRDRLAMLNLVTFAVASNPDMEEEEETTKSGEATPEIRYSSKDEAFSESEMDGVEDKHDLYRMCDKIDTYLEWTAEKLEVAKALIDKDRNLPCHKVGMRGSYGGIYNYSTPFIRALNCLGNASDTPEQPEHSVSQRYATDLLEYMLESCPKAASVGNALNGFPLHVVCRKLHLMRDMSTTTKSTIQTRGVCGKKLKATSPLMHLAEQIFDLYPKAAIIGDDEGCTPLMLAVQRYAPYELVDMLCRKCPEAAVVQRWGGETPQKFAEENIAVYSELRSALEVER